MNKQTSRPFFQDSAFGWDGFVTFIVSNIILILTLGGLFFYLFFKVMTTAVRTQTVLPISDELKDNHDVPNPIVSDLQAILVAGLGLKNNQVTKEYQIRLQRAWSLFQSTNHRLKLLILGGITGNSQVSEARAGADFLIDKGITEEAIILEEQSRHSLENLQHARHLMLEHYQGHIISPKHFAIISSRYHLYRILTLSRGLQMNLQPIAAEDSFPWSVMMLLRIIKEAYYLHWYWCGKLWVTLTGNKISQSRIN